MLITLFMFMRLLIIVYQYNNGLLDRNMASKSEIFKCRSCELNECIFTFIDDLVRLSQIKDELYPSNLSNKFY